MEDTNRIFSKTDERFKACCEISGIPASIRQASKFRRKTGVAYQRVSEYNKIEKEKREVSNG